MLYLNLSNSQKFIESLFIAIKVEVRMLEAPIAAVAGGSLK